jgi:site-specific DNA-cytosine methylase
MLWFTKSRRAQNDEDYETWIEGGVMPTMNAFDNGDVRTTILITYPIQDGRDINKNQKGLGVGTVEDPMYTLDSVSGHGVITIFSHTQGLDVQPSEEVSPTLRAGGAGMAVAYDEFNDSISDTHHTLRSGTKQSTGVINKSTVRRLTPVECERLQGFPDDWTAGQSDSSRYKQMGNAVAVPVVEWVIGNICDIV